MSRRTALMLQITPGDPRPITRQIVDGVRRLIASGELPVGAALPSVRGLAQQLTINPNTVAKAYRELEREGLVAPRAGQGTFVTGRIDQIPAATYARLSRGLRGWLRTAHEAGLAADQVRALVAATLDDDDAAAGAA